MRKKDTNKVTIAQVAERVNVSKTLVSHYLNGKFSSMSEETRNQIENAISDMGYVPNEKSRHFKTSSAVQNHTIGLLVADITDPFYATLCKGVTDASLFHGYHVMIANTDNNMLIEKEYIQSLLGKTQGLIIGTVGGNDSFLADMKDKMPIVLVDRNIQTPVFDLVASNNYDATQELLEYALAANYDAFTMFTEPLKIGLARTIRVQAFCDFMKKNVIKNASVHAVQVFDDKKMMRDLMEFVEKNRGKKTVAIAANGRILMQLITCVNALSLQIPSQIGVCGYDDFAFASLLHAGITAINQPTYEIGYTAMERLLKRMLSKNELPEETILLRSKMMVRGSL